MLFFHNLVVNANHPKYKPFLFHLTSFRRRVLSKNEFENVCSMISKNEKITLFTDAEMKFYHQLVSEKQIIEKATLDIVDEQLYHSFKGKYKAFYHDTNIDIGIQITQKCNMDCIYCYEKMYLTDRKTVSKDMINHVQDFIDKASELAKENFNIKTIRITGGEQILDDETVGLVRYCAEKWQNAKLRIQTNGINIVKYYEALPLNRIELFSISLDGKKEIHMPRRFSDNKHDELYINIISGIKKLISNNQLVIISSVMDKTNYQFFPDFQKYLSKEGIIDQHNCIVRKGIVTNLSNNLGIDTKFNTQEDIKKMSDFFGENGRLVNFYPGTEELVQKILRGKNVFIEPSMMLCTARFFDKLFFAADGKVYICDCGQKDKGVLGTYYPTVSLNMDKINDMVFHAPIFYDKECKLCPYKYLCLGGCPLIASVQNRSKFCGIYANESILDNLSCNPEEIGL